MITLILAIAAGGGVFSLAYLVGDWGLGWSLFTGVLTFGVLQAVAGVLIQRRVKAEMEKVQAILLNGQKAIQAKTARWQFRPPSSLAAAQREIFEDTKGFVKEAIAQAETLRRFRPWVPMMERQVATAKLQLSWMVKDFKTVDALLPKAICIDPTMCCIKMARLYMLDRPTDEIAKVYRKAAGRVRYNGNVLLAATMSWVQVQRGDADGAFKTLTEALKKSDDETLRRNHETLMNNRVAHFTNSALGDQWYALLLEEPKMHVQRPRAAFR